MFFFCLCRQTFTSYYLLHSLLVAFSVLAGLTLLSLLLLLLFNIFFAWVVRFCPGCYGNPVKEFPLDSDYRAHSVFSVDSNAGSGNAVRDSFTQARPGSPRQSGQYQLIAPVLGKPQQPASLMEIDEDDEQDHESIELDAAINFGTKTGAFGSGAAAHPDEMMVLSAFRQSFTVSRQRRARCVRMLALLATILALALGGLAVAAQLANQRASRALSDARPALDDLSAQLVVLDRIQHAVAMAREENVRVNTVIAQLGPLATVLADLFSIQQQMNQVIASVSVRARACFFVISDLDLLVSQSASFGHFPLFVVACFFFPLKYQRVLFLFRFLLEYPMFYLLLSFITRCPVSIAIRLSRWCTKAKLFAFSRTSPSARFW